MNMQFGNNVILLRAVFIAVWLPLRMLAPCNFDSDTSFILDGPRNQFTVRNYSVCAWPRFRDPSMSMLDI